jgi:hypothetical protein
MSARTERAVDQLLAALGLRRIPLREAERRLQGAIAAIEAAIGQAGGPITIHDFSDEADSDVQARHRLA